jgi:hypothetical protein
VRGRVGCVARVWTGPERELGAILLDRNKTNVTDALTHSGVPRTVAHKLAQSFSSATSTPAGSQQHTTPALRHAIALAFAHSTQTVFYIMAAVMALVFLISVRFLPRGTVAVPAPETAALEPQVDVAS